MNKSTIRKARGAKYGDALINMKAFTKVLQAMFQQATQIELEKDLPENFGALVMVQCKLLRECFKYDADNYVDAENYLDFARELNEERGNQ